LGLLWRPKIDTLDKYIIIIPNIVPLDLCQNIIKEYINSDEWQNAGTGPNGDANLNIRNCDYIQVSHSDIIQDSINRLNIDNNLFDIAAQCIKEYKKQFKHSLIQQDTGYDLLRYNTGGFYTQHVDSFLQAPRLVSCSLCLNDDYEGGEFAFFDKALKYKLNIGDAIMFPSTFMYPHEIMPIIKGTRYSIITWFR